jgi:Ca2+-binding RTX toxin-like protein
VVERGAVTDPHGNFNGQASNVLSGGPAPPPPPPPPDACEVLRSGTGGPDALFGSATPELLLGLDGADVIRGRRGDDCLVGGSGEDQLIGGPGDDRLDGGLQQDLYRGGRGDDRLFTTGYGDHELVDCGPGEDRARVGRDDTPRNCEHVVVGRPER